MSSIGRFFGVSHEPASNGNPFEINSSDESDDVHIKGIALQCEQVDSSNENDDVHSGNQEEAGGDNVDATDNMQLLFGGLLDR